MIIHKGFLSPSQCPSSCLVLFYLKVFCFIKLCFSTWCVRMPSMPALGLTMFSVATSCLQTFVFLRLVVLSLKTYLQRLRSQRCVKSYFVESIFTIVCHPNSCLNISSCLVSIWVAGKALSKRHA